MSRKKVKVEITIVPAIEDEEVELIERIADYAHRRTAYIVNENEKSEEDN